MIDTDNKNPELENDRNDQEELSQKALGNTSVEEHPEQNNNDILSTPKISGTGSNNAGAAPESLIVHEDKYGEGRYEQGEDKSI
ncbi:hypothetical protein EA772_19140 [Pedobacter sp. G11]|uniref:hypothetical protein n=1 Tax=Pedobacter sp. G11 TaxID=2482728 RepID=UPI000F5DF70E|nr:hypothetical protein [Pedobacter sp. G11]AZI27349.1 hypothetical protein EA772_19140 [Pedobacter sp. G11]